MKNMSNNKNYHEEWTAIVNKTKYTLTEEQGNILREEMANGKRGIVVFDNFTINIPFVEEFYLSNKIYDKQIKITAPTERELTPEERKKAQERLSEIRLRLKKMKGIEPIRQMTEQEINKRRNKLLDQAGKIETEKELSNG